MRYDPKKHSSQAKKLVIGHFETLSVAVGSTPQDYFNLIENFPNKLEDHFFGYVGFIEGQNAPSFPVSLFLGEKIKEDTVALYATFSIREPDILPKSINQKGYTAISQYAYINVLNFLRKNGIKYADLGGSELENLNTFKRQFGAKELKTYWAVVDP